MRLLSATIEGYKRFADKTTVRLDDRLIAVVGPNEAGKTSLLRALAALDQDGPFDARENTRSGAAAARVEVVFRLDSGDKAALTDILGGPQIDRVTVRKGADGNRTWTIDPYPHRDKKQREEILFNLQKAESVVPSVPTPTNPDLSVADLLRQVLTPLDTTEETLPQSLLNDLAELRSSLAQFPPGEPAAGEEVFDWTTLSDAIADMLEAENAEHPASLAREILEGRKPRFILFAQADRDLASSYNLEEGAGSPPPALASLARLAKLDLAALHASVTSGDYGRAEHLEELANMELHRQFSSAWDQSEITVRVRLDDRVLRILVALPGGGYSALDERSDGLLWFVALFAFLAGIEGGRRPILLIDEAETHLHYDAQADLVQVMNTQHLAHSVIYTTHSAGCLPPDLGRGIRVVVPDDGERSHLENSFWASSGIGYRPLLMAMGASVLAFSAFRYALIGEGPVEAILLPTLLREASETDRLEYQVAPGLAVAKDVTDLGIEAARVAYLVDGDGGGDAHRQRLIDTGMDPTRILSLGTIVAPGVVLEDLVDADAYASAVNEELRLWQDPPSDISSGDLETPGRPGAVTAWCTERGLRPPSKVGVANRVVELCGVRKLVNDTYIAALKDLNIQIRTSLGIV